MYIVYMLECSDASLYTGITTDVERRFTEHKNKKGAHYTRAKKVVRVVYTEPHPDRSSALKREAEIKSWPRQKKLDLVKLGKDMKKHRIYSISFASVYPLYIEKAKKKGRTKAEVDTIIHWLTGYTPKKLEAQLAKKTDLETFYAKAPKPNPSRTLITGMICGMRVEEIKEPTMQEIRYLDKLIDELAKGRPMEKILRKK